MLPVEALESYSSPKIISVEMAAQVIAAAKNGLKRVGLCHGGFDLLHPGHIRHFESARKMCDLLFVSVTSDRFVSGRKGSGRPIFHQQLRAYSIASLQCVDHVVVTDFAKGVEVIEQLKPSYYIKGPDFIGKNTPGITAEREAIVRVGGEMKYTNDPKLSTTGIIYHIQTSDRPELLLLLDRDGTLIEHHDFFGKEDDWRQKLKLIDSVADYVAYLQTKYKTTTVVVSNQGGVARGLFTEERVQEIHAAIRELLQNKGVKINSWKYSPEADEIFVRQHPEISFVPRYVKSVTTRKPSPALVLESLNDMKKTLVQFKQVLMLGDRSEDEGLAQNLGAQFMGAQFINVKGKKYEELVRIFS